MISKGRFISMWILAAVIMLGIGMCEVVKADGFNNYSLVSPKHTQFVVEVFNLSDVCNVHVIFKKKVSSKLAEQIVSAAMMQAISFRGNYDILGVAYTVNPENRIRFTTSPSLVIEKGTKIVKPFKW